MTERVGKQAVRPRMDTEEEETKVIERGEGWRAMKRAREASQVAQAIEGQARSVRGEEPGRVGQHQPDPFHPYHSIGTALQGLEELKRLEEVVVTDREAVQQSLQLGGVDRVYSTEELVRIIRDLMFKVVPSLVHDLETLLASVSARYGVSQPTIHGLMPQAPILPPREAGQAAQIAQAGQAAQIAQAAQLAQVAQVAQAAQAAQAAQIAQVAQAAQELDPLVPPVAELARETMVRLYGSPLEVVEKKMSNREYMSRFRLNTRFASALLPAYDHTTAVPTIYGALERLLLADITICTVDGRAFQVVYELARTVKNDWLHHRFTAGWAEVVRQLGIEIGDMLVFERWTEDRTLLTMQIVKESQLAQENPGYAWKRRPQMTVAQRRGQF